MVIYNLNACPFCLIFSILVIRVRVRVLLDGGVSALNVLDIVLCAGAVVFIIGLCLVFLFLCLATFDCSTLGTTGVDILNNCWTGCVIDFF